MRWIALLLGLALMVLAGLWFFTPVLDPMYARTVPQYAKARVATAQPSTPATTATRGAAPAAPQAAPRSAAPADSGGAISTKALAENVMSMVNLGAGIIGAWFTFLSYRMQVRNRRRERSDA